jgi:hypothetical protein
MSEKSPTMPSGIARTENHNDALIPDARSEALGAVEELASASNVHIIPSTVPSIHNAAQTKQMTPATIGQRGRPRVCEDRALAGGSYGLSCAYVMDSFCGLMNKGTETELNIGSSGKRRTRITGGRSRCATGMQARSLPKYRTTIGNAQPAYSAGNALRRCHAVRRPCCA